MSRPKL